MIKRYSAPLILLFIILSACSKEENVENLSSKQDSKTVVENLPETKEEKQEKFDPNNLVELSVDQSEFPYFSLPEDYKVTGFKVLDYQKYYFAIHNKTEMLEGVLYRTPINVDASKQFSDSYFEKKFDDSMKSMGAQKLNDSVIQNQLYEKLPDYVQHAELNTGKKTYTYGFKNKQGHPVIIQMTLNSPVVVVMEIKPDQTKMKKVNLNQEEN